MRITVLYSAALQINHSKKLPHDYSGGPSAKYSVLGSEDLVFKAKHCAFRIKHLVSTSEYCFFSIGCLYGVSDSARHVALHKCENR